jgi:hypothetical protein
MKPMKESDWKIFKQIKEKALARFCEIALADFSEIINNNEEHICERYTELYKLVRMRDKELAKLFDDHSRPKATLQLLLIRKAGLADYELLQKLSDEFSQDTDPERLL